MTCWYQVNPLYFGQIARSQGWCDEGDSSSFFALLKQNLNQIVSLGCEGLWLMPIYIKGLKGRKGQEGSPYAIREYQIDTRWGTEEELSGLIRAANEHGLKVIGEVVPNHLAPDAPFLDSAEGLYYRDSQGQPLHDQNWTDTVKLNHQSPQVQGFFRATLLWLSRHFGFEGFRLDMAHYPMYGAEGATFGGGDPEFWGKVLDHPELKKLHLIAEVYDDRSKDFYGYRDHLALIKEGIFVYDKKAHDLMAWRLLYQPDQADFQRKLYDELYVQAQVMHSADRKSSSFLRFSSNHDDCPGLRIYGSYRAHLTAMAVLAFLPGDFMVYAGEEYGHKVKPSVAGVDATDQYGQLQESNQIRLPDRTEQADLHQQVREILKIRSSQEMQAASHFLMVRLGEQSSDRLHQDLVAFVRFSPETGDLILIAVNLNQHGIKSWARISHFFPTFDFPSHEFEWNELLNWVNPGLISGGYQLRNLKTGDLLPRVHKANDELWVGVDPLEYQILKIETLKEI